MGPLLLAFALAQAPVYDPDDGPILSNPATMSPGYAFFEFGPASGAGMGTACACTAATGARGEAMTFARASSATCTKGGWTTGIADSDLVSCGANLPRVGSPTGSGLMLLVESARTNSALRSQEFDNVAWVKQGTGVAAPIVTANFGTAPDGTATAERVRFAACPGATESVVLQNTGTGSAVSSVYVKGNGTSGSVSICQYGGVSACVSCAFVSATWTRCLSTNTGAGGGYIMVGCQNQSGSYAGASNTGAADVLLWGAQHEAGAYATSYIPTTSAAATRSAETASFAVTAPLTGSVAVSNYYPYASTLAGSHTYVDALAGVVSGWRLSYVGGNLRLEKYAANALVLSAQTWSTGDTKRWAASFDGTNGTLYVSGSVVQSGAFATPTSPAYTPVGLGFDHQGFASFDGYIGQVCIDPSPTRCR